MIKQDMLSGVATLRLTSRCRGVSLGSQPDPVRMSAPHPPSCSNMVISGSKKQDGDHNNAKLEAKQQTNWWRQGGSVHYLYICIEDRVSFAVLLLLLA